VIAMMRAAPAVRMLAGMNILPIPRIAIAVLTAVAVLAAIVIAQPSEASHHMNVITEDVYKNGNRVGTSDISCTVVRIQLPKFEAMCFNTTTLPGGQITAQGIVTSDQIEKVPFVQAVTGGTGAYEGVGGELTVDEAGDKPAALIFELSR
jgi:hypothetical protein